jgi:hypothetical protein
MTPQLFYWIDLSIAISIPIAVVILRLIRKMGKFDFIMFWIGCAIGALWEMPFYFIGPSFLADPLYLLKATIPYPLFLLHFVHCFWDGGIFMLGVLLIRLLCKSPQFTGFRLAELLVLLIWGAAQELAVELMSTGSSGWAFVPHWWNPTIFQFNGSDITLIPQLIWLIAPVFFYLAAIKVAGLTQGSYPTSAKRAPDRP